MTARKPLAVGDRVRVYEGHRIFHGEVIPLPEKSFPEAVHVLLRDHDEYFKALYHGKQCRRLRPRAKKKEPDDLSEYRMMAWLVVPEGYTGVWKYSEECAKKYAAELPVKSVIHEFQQIRPGEVILDRTKLAEALKGVSIHIDSLAGIELCQSLSLPSAPAKEGKNE